jgi:hypothetical protein
MDAPQRPVVGQTDQEASLYGHGRLGKLSATRERCDSLGEGFHNHGWAARSRARKVGRIKRRMRHEAQSDRNDAGKVFPKSNDDRVQVRERILRRLLGTQQLLEVGPAGSHRREEEFILAAEALIEDPFRDSRGVGDFACRRGMPLLAENVSGDVEHFVIGDRLLATHAAKYSAAGSGVPILLNFRCALPIDYSGDRLTYK